MPSNHLILCRPLLLLPSIFPSIRVFSNESALRIRWPKYWTFSFSISPSNEHPGLISFRMNWLDLFAVQGTLKSLLQHHSSKASILQHSGFFIVQLSHPYCTSPMWVGLTQSIEDLRSAGSKKELCLPDCMSWGVNLSSPTFGLELKNQLFVGVELASFGLGLTPLVLLGLQVGDIQILGLSLCNPVNPYKVISIYLSIYLSISLSSLELLCIIGYARAPCDFCSCCCQVTSVVSNSVRPHRRQPTRLPRPWGFPGKNWSGLPFPSSIHESKK